MNFIFLSQKIKISQLIPDLQNLKNEYLDLISYLKLISVKPEEFNPKIASKILENSERVIPLEYLSKVYKISEEYAKKSPGMIDYNHIVFGDIKIDPLYISGVILKYSWDIEDIDFLSEHVYGYVDETINDNQQDFLDHDKDIYTEIRKIYSKKSELEIKLKKVVGMTNINIQYSLIAILVNAFQNLKKADSQVYDTDDYYKYFPKLVPYVKEIVDCIDI